MSDERFRPRPRDPHTADLDRWPAVRDGLLDLLAECSMIVDRGRSEFDEARSLTYRADEAVVIQFDDLLGRLPDDRLAMLPADLSLAAVRRTGTSCRTTTDARGKRSSGTSWSTGFRP